MHSQDKPVAKPVRPKIHQVRENKREHHPPPSAKRITTQNHQQGETSKEECCFKEISPNELSLELDTQPPEILDESLSGLKANRMHTGFSGAPDKTLHIVDENRLSWKKTYLLKDAAIDLEIGLSGSDFMRRKFPLEMAEKLEMFFDITEMKLVGIRD